MSLTVQKGNSFLGAYSSPSMIESDNWGGTVSLYATYPGGSSLATIALDYDTVANQLKFTIPAATILNLGIGSYTLVSTLTSSVLGISITKINYLSITDPVATDQPMTRLTMTIAKVDATPVGQQTKILTNTVDGMVVNYGWKGVKVVISHPSANNIGTDIIGVDAVTVETDAAGFALVDVIKGSIVTVACPSFGKSVTVDTAGLDTIDLSEFF